MKRPFYLLSLLLLIQVLLKAQTTGNLANSDAISSGMGNSATASSRGIYAIGRNPANLALGNQGRVEFSTLLPVPSVSMTLGTNFLSISQYNHYFSGITMDSAEKDNFKSIFKDGGRIFGNLNAEYLSLFVNSGKNTGSFAFSIADVAGINVSFPKGIIELAMDGNTIGKLYDFGGTDFKASWLRTFSLNYARDITDLSGLRVKTLSAGIGIKYVQGFAYVGSRRINSSFQTLEDGNKFLTHGDILFNSSFSPDMGVNYDFDSLATSSGNMGVFPKAAGRGLGFDLGLSVEVNEAFSFGLSVTDIGKVKWTENCAEYISNHNLTTSDITSQEAMDSIWNNLKGKGHYISDFSSDLPTALRIGASFKPDKYFEGFPADLTLVADYNLGFNNEPGNSKVGRFSVGAQYMPFAIWALRGGISVGGGQATALSFGTGLNLGVFELNIAAFSIVDYLKQNDAQRVNIAISSRWIL